MDGTVYMAIGIFLMVTATAVLIGMQFVMRKKKKEIRKKYHKL